MAETRNALVKNAGRILYKAGNPCRQTRRLLEHGCQRARSTATAGDGPVQAPKMTVQPSQIAPGQVDYDVADHVEVLLQQVRRIGARKGPRRQVWTLKLEAAPEVPQSTGH